MTPEQIERNLAKLAIEYPEPLIVKDGLIWTRMQYDIMYGEIPEPIVERTK